MLTTKAIKQMLCVMCLFGSTCTAIADELRQLNFRLFDEARAGNTTVVKQLLNQGAQVDARNRFGNTALLLAVRAGHSDTAKTLLAAGADASINNRSYAVEMIW